MPTHQETTVPGSLGGAATKILPFPHRATLACPHLRDGNRLDGVLRIGHEWIAGLPSDVRPLLLAMQYPRLLNLIATVWNMPPVAGTLLTDLLNDDRGDRDDFPGWSLQNCGDCTITTANWVSWNGRPVGSSRRSPPAKAGAWDR